jgi:hypothetical protein
LKLNASEKRRDPLSEIVNASENKSEKRNLPNGQSLPRLHIAERERRLAEREVISSGRANPKLPHLNSKLSRLSMRSNADLTTQKRFQI